jgi:hypothetical protein
MHFHYGLEQKFAGNGWYDAVIPNEVDLELFGEGLGLGARAGAERVGLREESRTLTPALSQGERETRESGPMVPIGRAAELTLGPELTPIPGPDLPPVAGQVRSGRVGPRSSGSATGGGASATTGRGFENATTGRGYGSGRRLVHRAPRAGSARLAHEALSGGMSAKAASARRFPLAERADHATIRAAFRVPAWGTSRLFGRASAARGRRRSSRRESQTASPAGP